MELKSVTSTEQGNSSRTNAEPVLVETINSEVEMKNMVESDKKIEGKDFTQKDVKRAIRKLNVILQDQNTHAEYHIHKKLNRIMIKIVDDNTNKVILEITPEKILDMIAKMCELAGVLVDKKA